jgi:MFS family permease
MYDAAMAGVALGSFWLGKLIEKLGEARLAAICGVGMATAMVLLGCMPNSPIIAILLSFLAGVFGTGTGPGLYLSVPPKWFDRGLGRALGLSVVGTSLGAVVMPVISSTAISREGWRIAYFVVAGVQVALTLCAAGLLSRIGALAGRRAEAQTQPEVARAGLTVKQALASPEFWALSVVIFLVTEGATGTAVHLFPLYSDRAVPANMMAGVAAVSGVGALVGRVVTGFLLDRLDHRLVGSVTFAFGAIGMLWLAVASGHDILTVYVPPAMIGAVLGAESDLLAYMARRYFGLLHYAVIYNRLMMAYCLGAIVGPLSLGWAFDNLSHPAIAIGVMAASCALASGVCALLPKAKAAFASTKAVAQGLSAFDGDAPSESITWLQPSKSVKYDH